MTKRKRTPTPADKQSPALGDGETAAKSIRHGGPAGRRGVAANELCDSRPVSWAESMVSAGGGATPRLRHAPPLPYHRQRSPLRQAQGKQGQQREGGGSRRPLKRVE
jgi:hypothetical protein